MLFALELVLHPNQHMIAHVFGPAHQFRCSPLLVMLVRCGHMPSGSAHAITIAPWMTSDTRSVEVQTHELSTGVDIDTFADEVMRHRVKVLAILNVVVDIYFNRFNIHICIG